MINHAKYCLMHLSSNERYALKHKRLPNRTALYGLSLTRIHTAFKIGNTEYTLVVDLKNNTIQSRKRTGLSKWTKCTDELNIDVAKHAIEYAYLNPNLESNRVLLCYNEQGARLF